MFPRRNRLSRHEFTLVSDDRSSRRASTRHFSAIFRVSRTETSIYGCSVVVSKKVAKTSVGRHLLKRRIREAMRPWCGDTAAIIIFARAGSPSLPFSELRSEIAELLSSLPRAEK